MSEAVTRNPEKTHSTPSEPMIGQRLRARRELLELSRDDVAQSINLKHEYVCAIEDGRMTELPAIGYVLGYISSYACLVGLDSTQIVFEYKREVSVPDNLRLRDRPHFVPTSTLRLPRGSVSALGVIIFTILLSLWYGAQSETTQVQNAAQGLNLDGALSAPAAFVPSTLADGQLTFYARGPSWIRVTDKDGAVIVSRVFVKGQSWSGASDVDYMVSVRDAGAVELFSGTQSRGMLGQKGEPVLNLFLEGSVPEIE